jgi:hypothetical protein
MTTTNRLAILLIALVFNSSVQALTIDMVTVGNPGNAPEGTIGSVGYIYQIGKYEVTAGQYTEFLNSVAKADPNGLCSGIADFAGTSLVVLEIDGMASVPATGWGMIVNIVPQDGATGSVQFQPAAIVNDEPNLMPASQSPFVDFDRDFSGKSYGLLGASATQLHAFSHYVAPTLGPAPTLDPNGNLTLPDGSGLVSLPIILSTNASGDFLVTFDANPAVTGAIFATALPEPNDVGIHPPGTHMAGILSVINPAGDYNRNGIADAADYVLWRKTLGQTGARLPADGNDNNEVESGDYTVWRANFGNTAGSSSIVGAISTVPEPATLVMLLTATLAWTNFRRAAMSTFVGTATCDTNH